MEVLFVEKPKLGRPPKDQEAFAREVRQRLAERDEHLAADTRSEAQKWLGDPPAWRGALAQSSQPLIRKRTRESGLAHPPRRAAAKRNNRTALAMPHALCNHLGEFARRLWPNRRGGSRNATLPKSSALSVATSINSTT